jgi:hypothetical protein
MTSWEFEALSGRTDEHRSQLSASSPIVLRHTRARGIVCLEALKISTVRASLTEIGEYGGSWTDRNVRTE